MTVIPALFPQVIDWSGYALGGLCLSLLYTYALVLSLLTRRSDSVTTRLRPTALLLILLLPSMAILIASIVLRDGSRSFYIVLSLSLLNAVLLSALLVRVWMRW